MVELKKISVKKRKVSNLNNWEMGELHGGTDSGSCTVGQACNNYGADGCGSADDTSGYYCKSMALTMPCETYPKC